MIEAVELGDDGIAGVRLTCQRQIGDACAVERAHPSELSGAEAPCPAAGPIRELAQLGPAGLSLGSESAYVHR